MCPRRASVCHARGGASSVRTNEGAGVVALFAGAAEVEQRASEFKSRAPEFVQRASGSRRHAPEVVQRF